jgi:hypothetical protein
MTEIWKDIIGYEGIYQISNLGRVKSLSRIVNRSNSPMRTKEKIVQTNKWKKYHEVDLYILGKRKKFYIHRLIAIYFIPNPRNLKQINHIDGNKGNFDISNLEWSTQSENIKHAHDFIGINVPKGEKHFSSKLTDDIVKEIRATKNPNQVHLGKKYGVSPSTIRYILTRKTWKHI